MGPEVVNKNKNCIFNGPYAGRDLYITMYQDSEREFVVTHNANIKPVAYFTGRETELRELRQRIEEGRKSVLVSGIGGIGKTHICRKLFEEYLNKHAEEGNGPFRHIGYIEYNGDMGSSLQSCLKYMQQDNLEQNREAAWKELEHLASGGKLLLFVDNVDKFMCEDEGLQRLNGIPGAVILTSRQASFGDEFELYRIGFLGMQQCKEIYEKIRFGDSGRKIKSEEVPDLEYVIESLAGRHTITVELLAHLARTKLWAVKRLREELEKKGFRLAFHKDGEFVNIQESYEVLYDLSKLTDAEQNILEAFSVFPYIPLEAETCNEWLLSDAGVSEDDDILIGLYRKGWLQFDIKQESYAMHPVFARFIYEKCRPEAGKHSWLMDACKKSLDIPPNGSPLECQQYLPFAENIAEKLNMGDDIGQIEFIGSVAYFLQYISEYKKAEELYKKSLRISEKLLGEEHPYTVISYNNLALVYMLQGEYRNAEELYERSLQISEKVLGEENPDTATIYNNLAGVYKSQRRYRKAEEMYEKSLRIIEKFLGKDHPDTATIYNNLAGVYESRGKYREAEEMYEKSLQIRERVLGADHPDTAISYSNLAGVYEGQGEYKKAINYYLLACIIFMLQIGPNHEYTQIACASIEITYYKWKPEGNFEQWLEEKMKETDRD